MSVRLFTVSILLSGLAGLSACAAPPPAAAKQGSMASTPSGGAGDAEATACWQSAGSSRFDLEVCSHDHAWLELARNGKDLGADGKTLIDMPTVDNPKGNGDPDAVTCRTPKSALFSAPVKVCETNRFWADIVRNRQWVDARGAIRTRQPGCAAECANPGYSNNWDGSSGNSFPPQSFSGGNQTYPGYTP